MATAKYSVVKRLNPQNREEEGKWYAQAQSTGEISLDDMAKRINQLCTVTRPDVVAVLAGLQIVIIDSLMSGLIVRLGDLGDLRLSLLSEGAPTKKEFTESLIKKARIVFTPTDEISNSLKSIQLERTSTLKEKAEQKSDDASDGNTDDSGTTGGSDTTGGSGNTGGSDSGVEGI